MIRVTGDKHGRFNDLYEFAASEEGKKMNKGDYVIVLGDFGIWHETLEDIKKLDGDMPFTLMFLDGNHEHSGILSQMPEEIRFGGKVHDLFGVLHLCRGEIYEIPNGEEMTKIAVCGGGDSMDRYMRTAGVDWFEEEAVSDADIANMFENAFRYGMKVDYFLSHSPSAYIKSELIVERQYYIGKNKERSMPSASEYQINKIIGFLKAKEYFYGHEHIDRSFVKGDQKHTIVYRQYIKL